MNLRMSVNKTCYFKFISLVENTMYNISKNWLGCLVVKMLKHN